MVLGISECAIASIVVWRDLAQVVTASPLEEAADEEVVFQSFGYAGEIVTRRIRIRKRVPDIYAGAQAESIGFVHF